ncbi:endonuclease/exonuclease/phosphatase family protein [Xylanibacter oryzae]|uniref:endonuclease/exonuclease/phosphatase family protein n=1 Tax=Xylanibacter oryzae TaxID=185293 RepID=UPI0004B865FC|nr:endonuclease [Xylanibacter oryzae]
MCISLFLISLFTFVELNCENLFDCVHDSLKNDYEFLPQSERSWTKDKFWRKINNISRELISCGENTESSDWRLPDMMALCEIENDSVMLDLTKRSLLRNAGYEYVVTNSADARGIDVALAYLPMSFSLINYISFRLPPMSGMRATRDILYASGIVSDGDTLHIYVVHAPSRVGGEAKSRPHRMHMARTLCRAIDSLRVISPNANIIVAGDFNDYFTDSAVVKVCADESLTNISCKAKGRNGALATYRYKGEWNSLDQILLSSGLYKKVNSCKINDASFLLEDDKKYGGVIPKRTFKGYRFNNGYSDHLPLVLQFN